MLACEDRDTEYMDGGREASECSEERRIDVEAVTSLLREDSPPIKVVVKEEVDVAIIGNGPSAMFLSLLLSGFTPYYTGRHPNTYLAAKLCENPSRSLIDQDLEYLSEGLEGRSNNPLSLLFDTLMQPNQDIGETHPPSLTWTLEPHQAISHVVLGRGEAGGSWHRMSSNVKSLSPARWLQLPVYSYTDWLKKEVEEEEEVEEEDKEEEAEVVDEEEEEEEEEDEREMHRVGLGSVASYYQSYIEKTKIAKNFRNNVTVTEARFLHPKSKKKRRSRSCESTFSILSTSESEPGTSIGSPDSVSVYSPCLSPEPSELAGNDDVEREREREEEEEEEKVCSDTDGEVPTVCDSDDTGISCCTKWARQSGKKYRWVMRGRRTDAAGHETRVCVCSQNLVLTTGVNDSPKKLGVPGEDLSYVHHSYCDVDPESEGDDGIVLVVGAGLSAADAVIHQLSQGHRVAHAFYQDTSDQRLVYHTMDRSTYSEYVSLFQKMSGKTKDPLYTPLSQHRVQSFSEEGLCTLCSLKDSTSKSLRVSRAFVLIGGLAQLDFLPECVTRQLGVHPDQPISTKQNPMNLDPITYQSQHFPSLFALGPLSGDNFVRFLLGGSIGITKELRKKYVD